MSVSISVIVPTRLRNHLLPRAVRSLLAQTWDDFEVLIVDDNPPESRVSTDPTLVSLLQHPKVRVLSHEHPRNAATARNVGLRAACGEWITYLDDDDAYRPTKLERQLRQAQKTGIPVGICGVVFHLAHRQRKRVFPGGEISGSELLLISLAFPTLFHRNAQGVFFDEDLDAGEDTYYLYQLLRHFKADRIFNVPEPLVDVFPQAGARVNRNPEGLWQATQAIYRDFAGDYDPAAAEAFLARSQLGYLKFQRGGLQTMLKSAWKLSRLRGRKEFRFVFNCFLFKVPLARRFLVS